MVVYTSFLWYMNTLLFDYFNNKLYFSHHVNPYPASNHLIDFESNQIFPFSLLPSLTPTDIIVEPWIMAVAPNNSKQMVQRSRCLWFLRSLIKSHSSPFLRDRLWFTTAGCPPLQIFAWFLPQQQAMFN